MDVQQQLKLDQIEASKTGPQKQKLRFLYKVQGGGGEACRKKASKL